MIGVEADASNVDFGRDRNRFAVAPGSSAFLAGTQIFNPNGLSGLDFFGTVRGRLGYAFDRTLVYGSGGFAYGSGGGSDFGLPNGSSDTSAPLDRWRWYRVRPADRFLPELLPSPRPSR